MSMLLWGCRQCNWRAPVVLHGLSRAAVGEWPDDEDWRCCSRWRMHTLSLSHTYTDIHTQTCERALTHTHTYIHKHTQRVRWVRRRKAEVWIERSARTGEERRSAKARD